jgi:N-acetylglucosamine-6-phosphate deacetylase
MLVSLGHTDATAAALSDALGAGATGFTHLGNGCPATLDRADNILWRVLDLPRLTLSLIPDRWHVSPPLFRLLHRLWPADAICYVSDAMAAAGAGPGTYRLGSLRLEVGPDQVVRLPGRPNLAGSALRPIDGVLRAAEMRRCSWQSAWDQLSTVPARFASVRHGLEVGARADFCAIEPRDDGTIGAVRVYARGERVE